MRRGIGQEQLALGLLTLCLGACYTGRDAVTDINKSWRGKSRASIEKSWGKASRVEQQEQGTMLVWTRRGSRVTRLPSAQGSLSIDTRRGVDLNARFTAGQVDTYDINVVAGLDSSGRIVEVAGPSLRYGPPNEANLHWGFLMGLYAGMGTLDDTETPLPSGGLYIGGMLSDTVGLVGTYTMVSGSDSEDGAAMAFAWGMGAQWWPETRLSVRAGPAMVLAFDPGFENGGLEPGLDLSGSYALVKSGTFALDLRLDLVAGPDTRFGLAGIGVNLN